MNGRVEDVMTRLVLVAQPGTPCQDMAAMMRSHRLRALPVVDPERHVLGIVTDTDLLFKTRMAEDRPDRTQGDESAGPLVARDVMSVPAVVVSLGAQLDDVTNVMRHRRIRHLPVVDQSGRLTGIVTPSDVLQKLVTRSELDELASTWAW
jgi:CBS-domain-containing membrane protein